MSDYLSIEMGIKGNIEWIDPKSKLLTTLVIVLGLSLSLYTYQITFFAFFIIPMLLLYKPNRRVILRILVLLPFSLIISLFMYFSIDKEVTVNLIVFQRVYTANEFILFNLYRFVVSAVHSSILIESEEESINLIEALASLGIFQYLVSILLLIHRLIIRLQSDFNHMLQSAQSKGYFRKSNLSRFFFKLRLMSRLLMRATIHGETIAYTLTARGFNQTGFTPSSRNWSSEGLTVLFIVILVSVFSIILPFYTGDLS